MNCKILFFLVILSLSSAQDWDWAEFASYKTKYMSPGQYFDYYAFLIAGRTYRIFALGEWGWDLNLTVTDSAGYEDFNEDWKTTFPWSSYDFKGSAMVHFTPTVTGLVKMRVRVVSTTNGQFYLYLHEDACSSSCLSKFVSIFFLKTQFLACQDDSGICSFCTPGKKCTSCPAGQYRYGGTCVASCIDGTYADSATSCQRNMID